MNIRCMQISIVLQILPAKSCIAMNIAGTSNLHSGDKRMLERLNRRTSLLRIEIKTAVQEINEARKFLEHHIIHVFCVGHEP